ncbi:MAG: choice-of-anchor V domain-containing protein [Bacteroidota bacterium]
MKRTIALSLFGLIFFGGWLSYLISSSSGQPAGYAGEPGGTTCVTCHNSFALNSGGGFPALTSNIPAAGYQPGQSYTITARIEELGINKFGFQATVFGDASNMGEGTIQVTDANTTRIFTGAMANYITHTVTGNFNPGSYSWNFDWVAPEAGTDSVTVYASFVSANEGNGNKGDDVYTTILKIGEAPAQSGEVRAFLAGYYNAATSNMGNQLQSAGLLPSTQPYNYPPFNYTGTETLQTQQTDITDWVLLEVREDQAPQNIVQRQAVLLTQDGQLISANGSPNVLFPTLPNGNYYLAIRHKSHLGVISSSSISIDPQTPISYDYTTAVTQALGDNQLKLLSGNVAGLFVGDFDNNGLVNNQDFNLWKQNSAAVNAYLPIDADGNGIVNNLDFNQWKGNPSKVGSPDL